MPRRMRTTATDHITSLNGLITHMINDARWKNDIDYLIHLRSILKTYPAYANSSLTSLFASMNLS
jgi:hypothetical protein